MNRAVLLLGVMVFAICGYAGMASGGPTMGGMDGGGGMSGPGPAHDTHLRADKGPQLGDRCDTCHDGKPGRRTVNYDHCIPCHSPDGAFDGMYDPVIGARYNWGRMYSYIYNADGTLRTGKEQWCAGCHDDGTATIDGVPAPNVTGRSLTGDWESPYSLVDSDIPGAANLLDSDLDTGNEQETGSYLIVDLGDTVDISHIRVFTSSENITMWEVYGSTDLDNWTRLLLGQAVIFALPAWQVGPEEGWNSTRLDKFIPVRYLKLVKVSPWPYGINTLREIEFKQDLHYGYYDNGHKIGCGNCHDLESIHIDGEARTYEAALDNYNSGYRLKDVVVDGVSVPAMEIPRTGCNSTEDLETTNDFALCFKCHDRTMVLGDAYGQGPMFQDPLQTNFRNDLHIDENGFVSNEHVRHMRGRGYCGNSPDWDSDWDDVSDSPMSCTACHNVHGAPTPAMTRHGELASTPGTLDSVPMINFKYINSSDLPDSELSDVMESTGGMTQFYWPGPGTVDKNATCNMCHNDSISYRRTPVDIDHSLLTP